MLLDFYQWIIIERLKAFIIIGRKLSYNYLTFVVNYNEEVFRCKLMNDISILCNKFNVEIVRNRPWLIVNNFICAVIYFTIYILKAALYLILSVVAFN